MKIFGPLHLSRSQFACANVLVSLGRRTRRTKMESGSKKQCDWKGERHLESGRGGGARGGGREVRSDEKERRVEDVPRGSRTWSSLPAAFAATPAKVPQDEGTERREREGLSDAACPLLGETGRQRAMRVESAGVENGWPTCAVCEPCRPFRTRGSSGEKHAPSRRRTAASDAGPRSADRVRRSRAAAAGVTCARVRLSGTLSPGGC